MIQPLEIGDNEWWENLNRLLGLAWAIQSFARPRQQDMPNPALADGDLQDLRTAWLALTPDRRDRQYDVTAGPWSSPSPKQPTWHVVVRRSPNKNKFSFDFPQRETESLECITSRTASKRSFSIIIRRSQCPKLATSTSPQWHFPTTPI